MIEQTDEEKRRMYQELLDAVNPPGREQYPQPNITTAEYAKQKNITVAVAYERLERAVEDGRLKKQKRVSVDGFARTLYWKA